MSKAIEKIINQDYRYGFVTDIASDSFKPGLNEDVVRLISAKKNEPKFMLKWRLEAFRKWVKMTEPKWAHVKYTPIDYQKIIYYWH